MRIIRDAEKNVIVEGKLLTLAELQEIKSDLVKNLAKHFSRSMKTFRNS